MKALIICPTVRPAVPHLAGPGPLALAPIFGSCVVCHWIEHLAALGARHIQVIAPDSAEQVRAAVGDGARWGVRIEVIAANAEPSRQEAANLYRPTSDQGWLPAPNDIVTASYLPGSPELHLFESYASWFMALVAWMPMAITPSRIRVRQRDTGIWVSNRARISPSAELVAPCWIGDQATVGPGAVVGQGAILEDRSVVEEKASVTQSWVGPDTFVGPMTSIANSLAWGSTLIDWRTDSSLHVPDPFLLSSLIRSPHAATTDRFGRALSAPFKPGAQPGLITALRSRLGRSPIQ
jgi:hypothetical protein